MKPINQNNMKQTAVEWLYHQIVIKNSDVLKFRQYLEQAKEIEMEQSKQDYDAGLFDGTMDDVKDRLYKNAEQYYIKTYGSKD